jgi:penicillin-binding protein 2D
MLKLAFFEVNKLEIITPDRLKSTFKYIRAVLFISFILSIFLVISTLAVLFYAKLQGAPPLAVPQSTLFYADDGTLIGESHYGQKRYWVSLDDISDSMVKATIAIEDRKFYDHYGFDFKRIIGAAIADLKAMAKVQGASTITQQYARNLFLEHDKTWIRKLYEALYTIRLEMNYTKQEILEGYLNTIYYGHGAYGIEAAAHYYFGKRAKDLTLSEASMLAAIPKGPNRYSPMINEKLAKGRQKIVLDAMVKSGFITEADSKKAYKEKLHFVGSHKVEKAEIAPYFEDVVRQKLRHQLHLDDRLIEMGGLRVYTTLDPNLQQIAEKQMNQLFDPKSNIQAALVAMEPKTGEVKALIGGRDYEKSQYNRAVQAKRQPGSTFKPFLYYAALKNGFTPSTEIRSELTTFTFDDGHSKYTPGNYNNYYANDSITLAQAIALSDNVYAVKTHLFIGQEELIKTAKKLGISSPLKKVPSLALGTSPVTLIDMVNAYSILANGGKKVEPVFIKKVVDYKGDIIYESTRNNEQILDPDVAFVTTHLMTGMFDTRLNDYTTVTGQTIIKELTRPYAGKSGSTKTDSWMIGYSPQLTTGIWTGYDKNETIVKTAEKTYAKKLWARFMEEALKDKPVKAFKPTKNVVGVYVNPDNGKLATESCPVARLTYYVAGTEPTEYCTEHHEGKKDKKKHRQKKEEKSWFKKWFDWF